jgi:zinc and cadmium transporter
MSSFSAYLYLILTALASGSVIFFFQPGKRQLKIMLAFSGAYLFGISVLSLIPEIYHETGKLTGLFILIGFVFQILLEFFSEGLEHGHVHVHKEQHKTVPAVMLISLCIHSFLEGMPIASDAVTHLLTPVSRSLIVGIIIHNVPISIALASLLTAMGSSRIKTFLYLLLFTLMAPSGALVNHLIASDLGNIGQYHNYIMAVVVGIFLHISTTILFETSENHKFNMVKFVSILFGMTLAWMLC